VIEGTILDFTIPQAPPALDDVTMNFSAIADLSASFELLTVQINGTPVGDVFVSTGSDCPLSPDDDQLVVPLATYNALLTGGDAFVELVPGHDVENPGCATFVAVTVQYRAFADFNSNGTPDACEPPDFDSNGSIDLQDFAAFQACLNMSDDACVDAFDRAYPPNSLVTADDLPFLVHYLTGPTGGSQLLIGGREMMSSSESETLVEPLTASLSIEVQPLGGGAALTTLDADTQYELHYTAGNDAINTFLVMSISSNAVVSIADADAATNGEWAVAGNFTFTDFTEEGPPVPAPGHDEGLYWYSLAMDGFWGSAGSAGETGHLCTFTTGSAGTLTLDVQLIGASSGIPVIMSATESWPVD